ncbi:dihydrofolate reductase [Candidatus Woesearchaeota archaeon]|nr:dihydrofolate reductase [Candidatus Woesearchaeota archaeon]
MDLAIIVAVSENQVIGNKGRIPWKISEDLKRFKALTMGHPIIMGRETHESIGKPLPGRLNIVLTSNTLYTKEGIRIAHSFEEAVEIASEENKEFAYAIGGQRVYERAMSDAKKIELTRVFGTYEGDRFFPEIDERIWNKIKEERAENYSFETYVRR